MMGVSHFVAAEKLANKGPAEIICSQYNLPDAMFSKRVLDTRTFRLLAWHKML